MSNAEARKWAKKNRGEAIGIHKLYEQYGKVFDSPEGQFVLFHILRSAHVLEGCYIKGDPYASAANEGARDLALSIMRYAKVDMSKLIQLYENANTA